MGPHLTTICHRAEALDAHRKRQQALHPDVGLTDMYNVMEKLRSEFQNPAGGVEPIQVEMELEPEEKPLPKKQPLPKEHTA